MRLSVVNRDRRVHVPFDPRHDAGDEGGREKRSVDRGDEHTLGGRGKSPQPGSDGLERPTAGSRVLDDLDVRGQRGQTLTRRAHDDDRSGAGGLERPADDLCEGVAVPVELGLWPAHALGATTDEHDPRERLHAEMLERLPSRVVTAAFGRFPVTAAALPGRVA